MSDMNPKDNNSDVADTTCHRRSTSQTKHHDADRTNHVKGTMGTGPARLPQSSKQRSSQARSPQQGRIPGQGTGILESIASPFRMIFSPSGASASQQYEQARKETERLTELLKKKDRQIEMMKADHQKDLRNTENDWKRMQEEERQKFDHVLKTHYNRWHQDHDDHWQQINHDHGRTVSKLQMQLQDTQKEKEAMLMEHEEFIRVKQEASFGGMESGRWAPAEESKIFGQLNRLKRDMRTWAKEVASKDLSLLKTLDKRDLDSLMDHLSNVVVLQNDQLPAGLTTPKSPALLLNALFSHMLYSNLLRSPFFFLEEIPRDGLKKTSVAETLEGIYKMAQKSNAHDAHTWRSDMLRLLLPPPGSNTSEGEKLLHDFTDNLVCETAGLQASRFLAGPASRLMKPNVDAKQIEKCKMIFQEAARFSYQLWTRRTMIRSYGLKEMGVPTFSIANKEAVPHSLVRHDDHNDQLEGRPITVIVHPLIKVYGTGAAEHYDSERIWVPAEVWLDSK
ncbi:hypothetical protein IFR04_011749 [Cadophora malorum]|uniref:Uncharacterized protein n=1 Tax=Cadophora malorum TaxID=108018 RepID=A0A8H7T9R5_9HELO|nr:hypothetical protein IFR04_011749 [Cadophora malorum]